METIYSFGEWMKRRRTAVALTQRELAERTHCSTVTIKKIEADQRRPSVELAELLAKALAWPQDQVDAFIECARGQRPVDYLERGSRTRAPGMIVTDLLAITPPPLPLTSTPLIGREAELELLQRLLTESWLVTIAGVGGIGKTRLSLAIATRWQYAGQIAVFVSLASLKPDSHLAAAIAESLGLRLSADFDPTSQLLAYLANKELLLVLDNFEHLLASASLLTQMHHVASELTILVTSRERLRLPGEQLLPLTGLDYPRDRPQDSNGIRTSSITHYPAVQLYLNHARRLLPGFGPDDDDVLLELCRITDGLPLALELAAAWVETLTLPELVQKLARNLDLLAVKEPHRPARHQSIRAVFDTTWQFLGEAEREAFTRLSVFSGGFSRQAAEAIAEISLSTLSKLVGRYLVQLDHTNSRYTLHELMRQYTAEKLALRPELEQEIRQRHATFYNELLAAGDVALKGAYREKALAGIQAERANIWVAWHWSAKHPQLVSLADAIAPLGNACQLRSWIEDGYTLFTETARVLITLREQPGVFLCLVHLNVWRARFAYLLGKSSEQLFTDVRIMLMEHSPSPALRPVLALYHLFAAETLLDGGEREVARTHAERALGLYEGLDDGWGHASALTQLGTVCWNVGAYDKALTYFEESLTLHRELGDSRGIAYSLDRLGLLLMHRGKLDMSCRYLEQAIDLFRVNDDRSGLADAMENLGSAWLELGRFEDAHRQYSKAAVLFEELGLRHSGYTILKALTALTSAHAGNYLQAAREAKEAAALSKELGHKRSEGLALIALGMSSVAMGNDSRAATELTTGTGYMRDINQPEELAVGIGVQALVYYRQGELEKAKQSVLAALAIIAELRGLMSSPDYPLGVWAVMLSDQGEYDQATDVYQLVLAEPFGAASRWFEDMCGRFISHSPRSSIMSPEERWAAITQLYQSLK